MTNDAITKYLAHLVDVVEGPEYTDDPSDSGGPTKYGVTLAALSRYRHAKCTAADVQALTRDEALALYRHDYVDAPGYGLLAPVSMQVALEAIDSGINCGQATSTKWLQQTLNALNYEQRNGADLKVDGQCGPATAAMLKVVVGRRGESGESVVVAGQNAWQGVYYMQLAGHNPAQRKYTYGWIRARVVEAA